ncbi:MAG: radical SAM protein [Bacteroidales bacterium]|nr:radical SAM protein [Bacteroidales bacterium]
MENLEKYLSNAIGNIMFDAYKSVIRNPRQALFILNMQKTFAKSEKKRNKILKEEKLNIPPFLISGISSSCNLTCKGCYARANNSCGDLKDEDKGLLTANQWRKIFKEASHIGVNFIILVGGEPLLRKEVLLSASEVKDIIFPVFTNGTLISEDYANFFANHLNIIPILSIEGEKQSTDSRRGIGVYDKILFAMQKFKSKDIFFGCSITVTTENFDEVTSSEFLDNIHSQGCKLIFYVEYVPTAINTEHLAFKEEHVKQMEKKLDVLRNQYSDMIFFSFPGDEKVLGGCLAAGRGFFYIGANGDAEVCPFSPYSDMNVAHSGLKESLKSPFFENLRLSDLVGGEHNGGCVLFEHKEEVKNILKNSAK